MPRIQFEVYVDVRCANVADVHRDILEILKEAIPERNPEVFYGTAAPIYQDTAKIITREDLSPGGKLFMRDEARFGWWIVRSTDPKKEDLFLPPHIFRKCFRFENVDIDYFENFIPVQEI